MGRFGVVVYHLLPTPPLVGLRCQQQVEKDSEAAEFKPAASLHFGVEFDNASIQLVLPEFRSRLKLTASRRYQMPAEAIPPVR